MLKLSFGSFLSRIVLASSFFIEDFLLLHQGEKEISVTFIFYDRTRVRATRGVASSCLRVAGKRAIKLRRSDHWHLAREHSLRSDPREIKIAIALFSLAAWQIEQPTTDRMQIH
jgi:hypothetical protein